MKKRFSTNSLLNSWHEWFELTFLFLFDRQVFRENERNSSITSSCEKERGWKRKHFNGWRFFNWKNSSQLATSFDDGMDEMEGKKQSHVKSLHKLLKWKKYHDRWSIESISFVNGLEEHDDASHDKSGMLFSLQTIISFGFSVSSFRFQFKLYILYILYTFCVFQWWCDEENLKPPFDFDFKLNEN